MIIADLVNKEQERSFIFSKQNPEVVLPDNIDINASEFHCPKNDKSNCDVSVPTDQLGWTTVGRSNKNSNHPL
jgi:hypothetical protein